MSSTTGPNEQVIAAKWNSLRSEIQQMYSKVTELDMELSEHRLVITALEPMDPSRRCYRAIGGVLVERTVDEVLPAVKRNKEGLGEVIERLAENLAAKRKELADLEKTYNIKVRRQADVAAEQEKKEPNLASQGVLVSPADS